MLDPANNNLSNRAKFLPPRRYSARSPLVGKAGSSSSTPVDQSRLANFKTPNRGAKAQSGYSSGSSQQDGKLKGILDFIVDRFVPNRPYPRPMPNQQRPNPQHQYPHMPYPQQPFPYMPYSPYPQHPFPPFERNESVYSRKIVDGWKEGGCTVTCVAMAARVSYAKAREIAIETGGFIPDNGMDVSDAKVVLERLGISSTVRSQSGGWSSIPDFAIIVVSGSSSGSKHAVLFRRKGDREYIYDCNKYSPSSVSDYSLRTDEDCLEIYE